MALLPQSERARGILALYILSFFYATFGVLARLLSTDLEVFQQITARTAVAFLLCFLIFPGTLTLKTIRKVAMRDWWIMFWRCLIFYMLGIGCFTYAVLYTTLGNVAFIGAIPILPICGVFLFSEKMTRIKLLLIILSIAGVGLISLKDFAHGMHFGRGELLALVGGVFFNLGIITRRYHSPDVTDQFLTHAMTFFGMWICLIASLVMQEPLHFTINFNVVVVIIVAGFLICGNAFLANYGLSRVDAILAGNILTLESAFGVLLGFLIYSEIPEPKAWVGGIIIVGSVILMNYVSERKSSSAD